MSRKVRVRRLGDVTVVELAGAIRGRDTGLVAEKLEGAAKAHPRVVAVDLSGTTFVDSHGLGTLVYYRKLLGGKGTELVLVNPHGPMQDMLDGTNLDRVFRVVDTVEEL